LMLPTEGLISE